MVKNDGGLNPGEKSKWIDISIPLRDRMVYGYAEHVPRIQIAIHPDKEKPITLWDLNMKSHTGTHIDAPRHFIPDGITIDEMPLDVMIGPARVIEIKGPETIKTADLEPYDIRAGERILFKTKNSGRVYATQQYKGDFVTISPEAARYLAAKKIRLVGMDYLTIAGSDPMENVDIVHRAFLSNGIYIIEGLNLDGVEPGDYELVCLPLRLERGDAGPCRAVIRPLP